MGLGSILLTCVLCGLLLVLVALGVVAALPDNVLRGMAFWRAEILVALWGLAGVTALTGAAFRVEGEFGWFPVFGADGPSLPMLAILACVGGLVGRGRAGVACVLACLGVLALSPLVFGLFTGTALVLLAGHGKRGLCLPFAVLPACIPADSSLSVPLLGVMVLLVGWAIAVQRGPLGVLPACIGLFLLGRLLAEVGELPLLSQGVLLACGGVVACAGLAQAMRDRQAMALVAGLAACWYGMLVLALVLALSSPLGGADTFRTTVVLGMGAPVVALLGMLWVAQRNDTGEGGVLQTRLARCLLGVVLAQCSVLPPCGGFAVLWAALAGGSYSVEATQPVMALLAVMLVVFFVALGVMLSAALVRAGLLLLSAPQEEADAPAAMVLPLWVCAVLSSVLAFVPGTWLFVADHLVVGPPLLPVTWQDMTTVHFAGHAARLTPLLVLLGVALVLLATGLLVRVFGFMPFAPALRQVAAWRQGAPVYEIPPDRNGAAPVAEGCSGGGLLPLWPAWRGFFTTPAAVTALRVPGARGILPRRGKVFWRYARRCLFVAISWCEAQGMVLILLLMGAGLLAGLFVGK
ncbi:MULTISPECIES: hypothetical protein [Acetobacter]|uniref:NADH:quinone oxidoreductase/Mrp antiporter membrane subunit domain-containing protein n=2 Tax=Acetobacter TaxID=434 RepID=A0A841QCC7_9PROT|nr:hypothetical protein [Acetobacter lovaniensis]MBB6455914.1 hypothetical protein [Acetobacter lovaniensis]GBQ67569.1 hypothetical protein AA0474_1426 [Acetobacter lovaniensis NRIC 0474]